MSDITLGDVTVARIDEYYGPVGLRPTEFFPQSSAEVWERNESWLAPDFLDPESGICRSAIQTWLIRSEGRTILIDTGVGNGKYRPYSPVWSYLDSPYLQNLARAGVRPEDVDVVVNTHLHVDHVGWNTRLRDGEWVPTFPNATYLMPRRDFEFWDPEGPHRPHLGRGNQNVYEDSVAPVAAAGLVELWDGSYRIDGNLTLELAPGHTPGSSVIRLESGSDRAVFIGDLVHSALQFVEPDTNSCFCEDPVLARHTRRRVLGWAADHNALVLPAHLGGHGAAELVRDGESFALKGWAPFERVSVER
ncbi:MBL fold metallo-hydrolase [Nocardiopsis sp. CT-R113]|uniref:MBL fold metallo-hydrolase n=1 Tax=Nocardiopsis codii TaxID=3065942 RepID=A0ABU7K425_9ACTN|nr:MBL fold metallo-hydrolase [Nocardiopsis sp. CT-R113]MEE2036955.1 MBL fold metallo-hydrolase [Nocardiopsis sp. CT-R113]